jgi:predicted Na+-dependent transporter
MEEIMLQMLLPFLFNLVDRIIPDDKARAAAKLELMKTENQQVLSEMQTSLSAIVVEGSSNDVWTSRARPSFLYVMYAVIILCFVGGIIGVWYPDETQNAAKNIHALLNAIPTDLYHLFAMGYLGYTGARSFDKWRGRK